MTNMIHILQTFIELTFINFVICLVNTTKQNYLHLTSLDQVSFLNMFVKMYHNDPNFSDWPGQTV